jgi:phage baseplate assembly protein W
MAGLSPKLPLAPDNQDGYALNRTYFEMVQQNLKHIILTNPGERIMDPLFGVGIKKYLFEQNTPSTW